MPGPRKRSVVETEKIAAMLRDRAEGMTYPDLAVKYGYADKSGAYRAVQTGLAETLQEPADELRVLERERLQTLYAAAFRQVQMDHVLVSHGKVIYGVTDEGAKLAAIDRCLRIQERLAKLAGLDAPTRTEVVSIDAVDAEIARLSAELARGAAPVEAAAAQDAAS